MAQKPGSDFLEIVTNLFEKTEASIKELSNKLDALRDNHRDRLEDQRKEFDAKYKELSDKIIAISGTIRFWGSIFGVIGMTALGAAVTALVKLILK